MSCVCTAPGKSYWNHTEKSCHMVKSENWPLTPGLLAKHLSCFYLYSNAFLCSQRLLVPATGRTSRRRPATCCFTHTESPSAQCRCRHTGRGRCALVHSVSSPAPKEPLGLTLTSTVHFFMEPDSREYSKQRARMDLKLLSQLSAIAGTTVSGERLVPKADAHF